MGKRPKWMWAWGSRDRMIQMLDIWSRLLITAELVTGLAVNGFFNLSFERGVIYNRAE